MNANELLAQLVLHMLQHQGYRDTARKEREVREPAEVLSSPWLEGLANSGKEELAGVFRKWQGNRERDNKEIEWYLTDIFNDLSRSNLRNENDMSISQKQIVLSRLRRNGLVPTGLAREYFVDHYDTQGRYLGTKMVYDSTKQGQATVAKFVKRIDEGKHAVGKGMTTAVWEKQDEERIRMRTKLCPETWYVQQTSSDMSPEEKKTMEGALHIKLGTYSKDEFVFNKNEGCYVKILKDENALKNQSGGGETARNDVERQTGEQVLPNFETVTEHLMYQPGLPNQEAEEVD